MRLRGRGHFIFEAGQFEDNEAVHEGGEDHHEAHQHQLQAGHRPHLDKTTTENLNSAELIAH